MFTHKIYKKRKEGLLANKLVADCRKIDTRLISKLLLPKHICHNFQLISIEIGTRFQMFAFYHCWYYIKIHSTKVFSCNIYRYTIETEFLNRYPIWIETKRTLLCSQDVLRATERNCYEGSTKLHWIIFVIVYLLRSIILCILVLFILYNIEFDLFILHTSYTLFRAVFARLYLIELMENSTSHEKLK